MVQMMAAVAAAMLIVSTSAAAQDEDRAAPSAAPIVTRAPPPPPPPAPSTAQVDDATAGQIAAWIGDGEAANNTVSGVVSAMPRRDRAIHGEVGASIGSGGYRSAYGVANMPIGEHSDVTVAIADEHLGGGRGRGYGYGGGYGYRGGDRQSLGIAVNLNGVGRGPASVDCDREAPPKWSLGLPEDASLPNRCRRLQQSGSAAAPR